MEEGGRDGGRRKMEKGGDNSWSRMEKGGNDDYNWLDIVTDGERDKRSWLQS